ncbi:YidC/Oxa1 family membrane protein insertase [Geothrix mesophila]|uniref:YidC/Oxa1 family membrane protein insertase n=1 Tax=Geothrix mesophila TaxID=2922723 RepID=UPI001FADB7B8|nr:membrane protein insertase YidC [Geothrix sp. SG198]
MELWSMWTQFLQGSLNFLTVHLGFSEAVSIIALTIAARVVMMPISLTAAYRAQKNKEALDRIKPELDDLRKKFKENPSELAARTMALHRENGIKFFDKVSILNIGSQGIFGIGVFQCLKRAMFNSKFLWVSTLSKPDFVITLLVGALMLLGSALMPGATANTSMIVMLVVSVLVSVFFIAALPSAIGVYWATSNAVTVIQTLVLRSLLAKQTPMAA